MTQGDWTWRSDEVEAGTLTVLQDWFAVNPTRPSIRHGIETLLSENARLRAVLGHCPRGIAVLDAHGNLVGFNRELRTLVGATPVLGEPFAQFFRDTDREILDEIVRCASDDKRSAGVLHLRADRGDKEIEFFAATLPGDARETIGIILAGEERPGGGADEHGSLLTTNAWSAFHLAGLLIRQKVSAVLGLAQRALDRAPDPASLTACREALREVEATLTRTTAAPPAPSAEQALADLASVARRAARSVLAGPARRRVIVQVAMDDGMHVAVPEDYLAQILSNVISHAVVAVLDSGRLGIVRVEAEAHEARITVRVTDNGVGIEPPRLQTLLELGDVSGGDVGLELAIARMLIETVGGAMRIQSQVGEGTLVAFDLPVPPG